MTIKDKVKNAEQELKAMESHTQLREWAISQGMDNRSAFPRFKKALKEIGIDYAQMRSGNREAAAAEIAQNATHQVTLYSDAKASAGKFAITDANGEPVWYGRFFENDLSRGAGEQSGAELQAALKAVWFASKVAEAINAKAIKLNLFIDAQWLTYQDSPKQKGFALKRSADKSGVQLNTEWIPGKDNPADKYTTGRGFHKWQDNDLAALAEPIQGKEKPESKESPKPAKPEAKKPTSKKKKPLRQRRAEKNSPEVKALQKEIKGYLTMSPGQVRSYAKKINALRLPQSQTADGKSTSKKVLPATFTGLMRWAKNPGAYDLAGVDAPASAKPNVKPRKVTNTKATKSAGSFWQKIWNG